MKLKQALAGIAALASLSAAHAQSANTFYASAGWFHIAPQDSSDPLKLDTLAGENINQSIPGTGAGVNSVDTLSLSIGYFITDSIAAEAELGIPPQFNLDGEGSLSQYGKLGQARLWAPALVFKYYFNKPDSKFRPFAGLGVTHISFTGAKITNTAFLDSPYLGGPTNASTDSSWAPVFNAGFNYNFTKHWFGSFSVSYIPVSVIATLDTPQKNIGVATVSQRAEAKIHLNPLVTDLKVGYMF
jgi:outer membrane protein